MSPLVCRFIFCLLLASPLGCSNNVAFRADELELTDRRIVAEHRQQVDRMLGDLFGTPAAPRLPSELAGWLDEHLLTAAAGPVESHTEGVTTGLYRRHCARCHGVTGDGLGPTALYQFPYPRDFRRGVFKWKSTPRGAPPTDADLHALLKRGVPGTAMPSFRMLQQEEREALVEYVKYLSIRGQTERLLIDYVAEELDFDPAAGMAESGSQLSAASAEDRAMVGSWLLERRRSWEEAESRVIVVLPATGSHRQNLIDAGRALFHDTKQANCVKCHGANGAGDVAVTDWDDWNKRRKEFVDATALLDASLVRRRDQIVRLPASSKSQARQRLRDDEIELRQRRRVSAAFLPPRIAKARKLSGGVLRGGDQQLATIIREGIAGTPMPGLGDSASEADIVALAAYVRSLLHSSTDLEAMP